MDLGLSEEQELLKNAARDFLEKECPESLVREMEDDERGYSPDLWKKLEEQGWQGLPTPHHSGGRGFGCGAVLNGGGRQSATLGGARGPVGIFLRRNNRRSAR